jgi:hypothetical protein
MHRRPTLPPLLVLALGLAVGCGGSVHFDGRVLEKEGTRYRIGELSADWERLDLDDNDLAFHSPGKGTIGVNASCGDYDDVPPQALMNHLFFGTSARRYLVDEEVTLDGRGARHVLLQADLDGAPIEVEVFLVVRSGCVYDLSEVRRQGPSEPLRQEFARFVAGFSVLEPRP